MEIWIRCRKEKTISGFLNYKNKTSYGSYIIKLSTCYVVVSIGKNDNFKTMQIAFYMSHLVFCAALCDCFHSGVLGIAPREM